MSLYSIRFIGDFGREVIGGELEAANVSTALAQANHRFWSIVTRDGVAAIDPKGRLDVLDHQGSPVARIYCAEALLVMS
jgi:hypothetical protein